MFHRTGVPERTGGRRCLAGWTAAVFVCWAAAAQAAPKLRLVSATVGPVSTPQGASGATQTVEAYNAGDGNLTLQTASSRTWMSASAGPARACSQRAGNCLPISIQLQTASLTRGSYTGAITVSDPNALDAPQNITVTVQVGGGVPDQVNFYVAPNGSSDEVKFSANSNLGWNVSTQSGGPWLSLSLDGSGSFRFVVPYRITGRHLEGMAEGAYTGSITVSGSSLPAENKTVPVRLLVTSQPIARAGPAEVDFRLAAGAQPQQAFVNVFNGGLGNLAVSGVNASGGNWFSAERIEDSSLIRVTFNPANLTPASYSGAISIASNAVNGVLSVPVRLEVVAQAPPLALYGRVLNSGNLDEGLAPGGAAALFGEQLSFQPPAQATEIPLARELTGTRVLVNDQPVPLYYASYNQVILQLPFELQPGEAVVRAERQGLRGNGITIQVQPRAPRIIQVGNNGVVVNPDGSLAMTGGRAARPGEMVTIYCVGLGSTTPFVAGGVGAPVSPPARIVPAPRLILGSAFSGTLVIEPDFAGLAPSLVGLYQINAVIPAGAPRGDIPLYVEGEGYRSNTILLPIRE